MLFSTTIFGQFTQLGSFMAGSVDDAEKLFGAYISPYANGIGAGLSGGWYNTAKTHSTLGFDLTITLNVAIIPTADKTFNPLKLNLGDNDFISRVDIDGNSSPTAAGDMKSGPQVTYFTDIPLVGETQVAQFNLPKGSGFGFTLNPMIQAGIGIYKETEIIVRYSPELKLGDGGKVGLWGVGLKHSLKQWIPALKKLPIFEMSIQGGYTKLYSYSDINFQPSFYEGNPNISVIPSVSPDFYDNQEMYMGISNITANLLVSANLPVICIYGGIGISSTTTNLQLNGFYPIPELQGNQIVVSDDTAKKDPIDITIKNSDGSATKPRYNAGFRLKMAVITIHFDYTYANYSIATAGLGVTLR
ncbi:MAG: hypothetical protein A2W99_02420 [Bacteroidetes bacterium GWF2_33_16]|nr:MAG: hypothetical protein A2X00_15735 [Bacteroidetes bacterium GWE2_32_14]OFY07116.1 MAG: hypothetical protein A2W99_02420 [Bacteroidetes bacterium GWF2_33_16]